MSRYIFGEILSPFLISLFVLTGALFMGRSLRMIDLVVNKDVPVGDMLALFSYIIPRFLEIAIPMSLLLATMLAFSRLSHDSELVVMRATGLSFRRICRPVMTFAAMALACTLVLGFWIRPWTNYRLARGFFQLAKTQASSGLVPGVFNELGQLTIYAESINPKNGHLKNVIISDGRNAEYKNFIAKNGQIVSDGQKRSLTLRLYDGSISQGRGFDYDITYFEVNNIILPHSELSDDGLTRTGKRSDEMSMEELLTEIRRDSRLPQNAPDEKIIRNRASYLVEFHRRLAIPVSCLCLGLIAMALGIHPVRTGRHWSTSASIMLGICIILIYFVMFAAATAIGKQASSHIWLIMWAPDVAIAAVALFLFRHLGTEELMNFSEFLSSIFETICRKLKIGYCYETATKVDNR